MNGKSNRYIGIKGQSESETENTREKSKVEGDMETSEANGPCPIGGVGPGRRLVILRHVEPELSACRPRLHQTHPSCPQNPHKTVNGALLGTPSATAAGRTVDVD